MFCFFIRHFVSRRIILWFYCFSCLRLCVSVETSLNMSRKTLNMLNNWRFSKINLLGLTSNLFKVNVFVPSEYLMLNFQDFGWRLFICLGYLLKYGENWASLFPHWFSHLTHCGQRKWCFYFYHKQPQDTVLRSIYDRAFLQKDLMVKKSKKRRRGIHNNFHHRCLIVF